VLLASASCTNKVQYNKEIYTLKIIYPDVIMIDYNDKKIKVENEDLKYVDSLRLTSAQQAVIENSFRTNGIGSLKGKFLYSPKNAPQPPTYIFVRVFKNNQLQSEIQYDFYERKGTWPFSKKYRDLSFKEDLVNILENNAEIKKASDVYGDYNDRLWRYHMKRR